MNMISRDFEKTYTLIQSLCAGRGWTHESHLFHLAFGGKPFVP